MTRRTQRRLLVLALLVLCGMLIITTQLPYAGVVQVAFPNEAPRTAILPFTFPASGHPTVTLTFNLRVPSRTVSLYHLAAPGCIDALTVNGTILPLAEDKRCQDGLGRTLPLGSLLRSDDNTVAVTLNRTPVRANWSWHFFDIRPARMDPLVLARTVLTFALILIGGWLLSSVLPGSARARTLLHAAIGGVMLRTLYALATGPGTRSYDWWAHLEYIETMLRTWTIPAAAAGWETFQPPLYYALAALWARTRMIVGDTEGLPLGDLQIASLLLTCMTLVAGLWIGTRLFAHQQERRSLAIFSACIATFPGLVLMASRISNDIPALLLLFATLAALLHWWQTGRQSSWYLTAVLLALGLLVKSTALPLLAFAGLCAFLKAGLAPRERIRLLVSLLTILILLAGWLPVWRFVTEGSLHLVGNIDRLSPLLRFEPHWTQLLILRPWHLLVSPFVDDFTDGGGRAFFWEYWLRSAHVGEFAYGMQVEGIARLMLLGALLQLPLIVRGAWKWIAQKRERTLFPLVSLSGVITIAHIVYRFRFPFATNQDFRFSMLLVLPLAAFAAHGIVTLRGRWREAATVSISAYLGACALFPLVLYTLS